MRSGALDPDESNVDTTPPRIAQVYIETNRTVTIPFALGKSRENLWVAIYGAGEVRCWNPATGELLDTVAVPGAKLTTSCAFGGPDLNDLYITSASEGLTEQEKKDQPLAGSLFRAELDVTGVPACEFAG